MVKIGDRVRFLNATGGGIVRKFQNKEIVLVEEEDGFETPVLIRECVVIETNSNNYEIKKPAQTGPKKPEEPLAKPEPKKEKYEFTELPGGDRLNVYLAFLPVDIKNLGKSNYETFLINDSNYYLYFNYMTRDNNAWTSRHSELIEPNTRLFIEEFTKEQINDLEKVCLQFIAFKKDKPYPLKNSYSVELYIDGVKFYKLHSFRENDFFEDDALVYPVVRNDTAVKELLISASDLQEAMSQKEAPPTLRPRRSRIDESQKKKDNIIEVDLHINQLLDTTAGLNNADLLNLQMNKFREVLEENKHKKGQKIVFIHGKGEGVLRKSLLDELKSKYKSYSVQDASFKEYGFGATLVTIR